MYVGILHLRLAIHAAQSLKDRRRSVKALTDRVRNNFNAGAADVDADPRPQRADVAFVCVSGDRRYLEGQLRRIVDFVEGLHLDIEVVDEEMEILRQ